MVYKECIEKKQSYDLIFMDIYMRRSNGIDVAKMIMEKDEDTKIVFTTGSDQHALAAYDMDAIGYLLKPIDVEKCIKIIDRFVLEFMKRDKTILFKTGGKMVKIKYDDIVYVESQNTVILIHCTEKRVLKIYGKLDDVETQLNDERFLRSHKSFLVNMNHIKRVEDNFITDNDEMIIIRTRGGGSIKNLYFDYIKRTNKA
jgi:DNA-binding LytR/AlgR family response regulator